MLPNDAPKVVEWRLAQPDEIPRGATTVANAARKAGWTVLVGYSRGPWLTTADEDEDADPADVKICEMITVQGRKLGKRFRVNWHRKLWTKDAEYKFAGGMTDPPVEGEVVATKAKKDRHPEHLGDKTVGGLKNSKTMNAYIREADSE
jgi:hypothetical protein